MLSPEMPVTEERLAPENKTTPKEKMYHSHDPIRCNRCKTILNSVMVHDIYGTEASDGVSEVICPKCDHELDWELLEESGLTENKGWRFESDHDEKFRKSIQKVMDYLWSDEQKHYQESESKEKENHIFSHLKVVQEWLKATQ